MSDFIETLKKNTEKVIDTTENLTKATIKKTSESVNTLKLNYAIKNIDSNINNIYKSLGKMLYDEYLNGAEFQDEYLTKCEKISELNEEIEILKIKIAEINNKQLCPKCKKYTDIDSKYCSACGYELNHSE